MTIKNIFTMLLRLFDATTENKKEIEAIKTSQEKIISILEKSNDTKKD
jgi:hypothetical protein